MGWCTALHATVACHCCLPLLPATGVLHATAACAVVCTGASMHAVGGKVVGAAGDYFRRLAPSELEAADPLTAEFERFVGIGWNGQMTAGAGALPNAVFIGAMGPCKPRLAGVA